jgi:hypothetical protein
MEDFPQPPSPQIVMEMGMGGCCWLGCDMMPVGDDVAKRGLGFRQSGSIVLQMSLDRCIAQRRAEVCHVQQKNLASSMAQCFGTGTRVGSFRSWYRVDQAHATSIEVQVEGCDQW